MTTRKIIDIEHNGEKVWPKGHAKATFMSSGSTVEDAINRISTNGKDGADGATFTPSVDSAGNLSWSNNKGLANPPTVNIKGPKGDAGEGGGGITAETDPVFSASPAASITEQKIAEWDKGATAVQPETLSEYALEGYVDNEVKALGDSLAKVATSGSYNDLVDKPTFKTINGESILGSGDIEISGGSGEGGSGIEPLILETGIHELMLEEMQPNKKYWLSLNILDQDGTISIGSFQGFGGDGLSMAEYFAVIDIELMSVDDDYSGTITLELPNVDISWANGTPPELGIGRYELSINCVNDTGYPYYNAVLTPFKII